MSNELPDLDVMASLDRLNATAMRIKFERDYLLSVLRGIVDDPAAPDVPYWLDARIRAAIKNITP